MKDYDDERDAISINLGPNVDTLKTTLFELPIVDNLGG